MKYEELCKPNELGEYKGLWYRVNFRSSLRGIPYWTMQEVLHFQIQIQLLVMNLEDAIRTDHF